MHRKNCCSVKALSITTVASVALFAGSVALGFYAIPLVIHTQVLKQTTLEQGTEQWDRFVKLPIPLNFKVWIWNVENVQEILNGGKPRLTETGPYVYNEAREKNIISLNGSEDTVTYTNKITMEFDRNKSVGADTDQVTVINPIFVAAIQMTSDLERLAFAGCMEKLLPPPLTDLFITVDVKTLLFDGLKFGFANDSMVACGIVRKTMIKLVRKIKAVDVIYKENGKDVDYMTLSFFSFKTNHPDGIYTVSRGRTEPSTLGEVLRWNNSTLLSTWGSPMAADNDTCNALRGTDATVFPPEINKDQKLAMYSTDICRVVEIKYTNEDSYEGIPGYRYEVPKDVFRPTTKHAENDCYCTKQSADINRKPSCFLDGLFDFMPCLGAPMLISLPHFLYADEHYLTDIDGMNPNESIHKMHLLIEPHTGTPLEGSKRVQINMVLRPEKFIKQTKNVRRLVLPVVWLEEGVRLTPDLVDMLKDQYFSKVKLAEIAKYSLIALTAALVVISSIFLVRKKCCLTDKKQAIQ